MVSAINRTLKDEMARDPRIVVFGEDVADASRSEILNVVPGKGGVFRATHGLQRLYGDDRVFNSTLAEAAIIGRGIGMATRRLKPVVEIQFFDYIWPAMMQLRDEMSMLRYRSGNEFSCPMVDPRADRRVPARRRTVSQPIRREHLCALSGDPDRLPLDGRGCGGTAADVDSLRRSRDVPGAQAPLPADVQQGRVSRQRFHDSVRKAALRQDGTDVVVVTWGALVQRSMLAAHQAEKDGISVAVLDLRTIVPYDWDAIAALVKRTNRVIVAHEDQLMCGFGAEIAARIAGELFEHLDAPVRRVGALNTPVAYCPDLEEAILPQTGDVLKAIRETARY